MNAPSVNAEPLKFSNTTSTVALVVPVERKHVDCTPGSASQSIRTLFEASMSASSTVTIAGMHEAFVSMGGLQSAIERNWSFPMTTNDRFSCVAPAASAS